ncbi:MAG: DUF1329 domain-containing protein, partial [Spongiibacteraceae bacterium]
MKWLTRLVPIIIATAITHPVGAAVSADEAKQLGGTLTQWGAEKAGNKDGSIPAWSEVRLKAPADFDPKEPKRLPQPFKEKPLFSITAQNMAQYADKMTVAETELFKKYPNFRMDIFPTHRTAFYPKFVIDNTLKNATSCKAIQNQLVLSGCYGGFPFPIPKTGNEVIWNHVARYTLHAWRLMNSSQMVSATGLPVLQGIQDSHQVLAFYDPAATAPAGPQTLYWKLRWDTLEPPRKAGEKYILLDALDSVNVGRRVYAYIPGQRRVKLAPDLAYDTPSPVSGGAATMDQVQVFAGAQDRYDFKLVGKQEKYINYNNYELWDYKTCSEQKLLTKNFMNPDCVRWELHRVWVVEATLKPGYRHVLPKRTLYFDEDSYAAGTSDDYDGSGKIYRMVNNPFIHLYNTKGVGNIADNNYTYDFQTGIWTATA